MKKKRDNKSFLFYIIAFEEVDIKLHYFGGCTSSVYLAKFLIL